MLPFHRRRTQRLEDMSGDMGMGLQASRKPLVFSASVTSADKLANV